MSDNTERATLAAFTALGAEIARLQRELEAERASVGVASERSREWRGRCDKMQRELRAQQGENNLLRDECAALREQLAQATQDDALPTWASVQRLMVQSGVNSIRRLDPFRWRAVSEGREWVGDSLAEAAVPAANAWAAAHGKVAQA